MKDSPRLAPKSRFIAAEPIKSEVRKVGETQKAMGEVDIRSVGVFSRVGYRFHLTYSTVRNGMRASGIGPPEYRLNNVARIREQLAVSRYLCR